MNNQPENKIDNIVSKITLIVTIILVIGMIVFFCISLYFLAPVDSKSDDMVNFLVEEGWSKHKIAEQLDKDNLIKSSFFFKIYMKINEKEIYAGTYKLSKSMSVDEIIRTLNSANSLENETISITFIEGRRLISYVEKISETFDIPKKDILHKISDEKYLNSLINQYWFLTEDILNKELYYFLEGYLFPDTYIFKKSSTIEEIIGKMLSTMEEKLSIFKEEINVSNYSIHQLLTLASIVELEGAGSDDRAGVAGVFYNRLKDNWTLGSDVTTYYAAGKDFDVDLSWSDINDCNAYNTRGTCFTGLPVGPIASPSLASITAVLEPTEHDYYYFVADINKKTYFNITEAEHDAEVDRLIKEELWHEY
ncbi:MAG: endolytic transglycosylase MltG [Bacilli bacterium]|nr:endolytic transglycosylase MltG [Bacilli bacterium]